MGNQDRSKELIQSARRQAVPLYQHLQRRLHDLRMLVFEVTQRCNLACRHRGSDCTRSSTSPDLPFDTIVQVLGELREAYDPSRITVMIGGGEPLMYERLFELGARVCQLGFPWGMVTNGVLWDESTFRAAREARISSISVSLDGPEEAHEWLRRREGSFAATLRTVQGLIAAEWLQVMDVITVVNPRNVGLLDEIFELMCELDAPGWRLIPISPIGRAKDSAELLLDREQFRLMLQKIMAFRARDRLPVYLSESNYMGPLLDFRVRDHHYFCRAGVNIGGVMADGDILACANIDRRFRQGNVFENSFVDVWEQRFQVFRDRRWMRTGRCASCDEWRFCQGNSFHSWDLEGQQPGPCHYIDFELHDLPVQGSPPQRRRRVGPRRRKRGR